jgi:hypothetical protein
MSRQEQKVKDGLAPYLEDGEQVLEAVVVRPRGWTQKSAGSRLLGASQEGRAREAAESAGIRLGSPMALALTDRRLLTIGISSPIGLGIGGNVKEVLSAVPLSDVDSIEAKRLALGYVLTVTAGGTPFKLEANAAASAKGLAERFEGAKAAV